MNLFIVNISSGEIVTCLLGSVPAVANAKKKITEKMFLKESSK